MKPNLYAATALGIGLTIPLALPAFASPKPQVASGLMSDGQLDTKSPIKSPTPGQPVMASMQAREGQPTGQSNGQPTGQVQPPTRELPALPPNLPKWLDSNKNNDIFYKRGPYNFAIYDIPALARDMNGVAVGHAMAYEALVTGHGAELETKVFNNIDHVLKNPPKLMPAERFLSPTFGQKYGVLELVFDWTHVSHAQTIDNFVSTHADNAQKDAETSAVWNYYKEEGAPFTVTGLPMNMAWLDSQPYSGAFRKKYPKVNALFWGYHWLQTSIYDGLRGRSQAEQKKMYEILGKRYHDVELYDTTRPFMPMMAETSPLFSEQYPDIANAFDNLHMLHDMVNDILASDWMTDAQKQEQIKRAIYIMSPDAHKDCKPGENRGVIDGVSHDHRFMQGMPGMGMMRNGTENFAALPTMVSSPTMVSAPVAKKTSMADVHPASNGVGTTKIGTTVMGNMKMDADEKDAPTSQTPPPTVPVTISSTSTPSPSGSSASPSSPSTSSAFDPTELMWMPKMGWMNMSQCHHCSMPLTDNGIGDKAWRASTVSAEGWTMRVRCALCARDMSAETKGGAILTLATEDPNHPITVFSDAQGNLTTFAKGVVFLEQTAGHPKCSQWSQAFTSRAAFDAYVKQNPKFANAKPLSFEQWANIDAAGTPDTYVKEEGPVKNPYAADLKSRGIPVEDGQ